MENGKPILVEPLGGLEEVSFPEPIGKLEAFYTDGLCSLPLTVGNRVKNSMFEKTLRYPGHVERVETLKQCGLLGKKPVQIGEAEVRPVDLLVEMLKEPLQLSPEGDILVMRIIVEGTRDGRARRRIYELIDTFDPQRQATAMARTTGFPATCAARMIARGELEMKGVSFPEQVFVGERFDKILAELADRGVRLTHREDGGAA
jgi:lysine 6-dehydrogenase